MTDEQIKQSAEECASKIYGYPYVEEVSCKQHYIDGYIAGAHSRDEEIEQLKIRIDMLEKTRKLAHRLHESELHIWTEVKDGLPEENQDVLIGLCNDNVVRNEHIGVGDINYMKEHPDLIKCWMLTPKV